MPREAATPSSTVLVDGIQMRWEERGSGPPVVLVHGIPTSPALWRKARARRPGHAGIADRLPQLAGVPARLVWSAAGRFQKVHFGERLAADLDGELVRIEGGKHFVPEDHPDEIARAIAGVLQLAPPELA